jgi:TonB family protein
VNQGNESGIKPARVTSRAPIQYPEEARRAGFQGVVVVHLLIDQMGQLVKSEVAHGHRRPAESVLKSLRQCRSEPRFVRGRPEIDRLPLVFNFSIRKTQIARESSRYGPIGPPL